MKREALFFVFLGSFIISCHEKSEFVADKGNNEENSRFSREEVKHADDPSESSVWFSLPENTPFNRKILEDELDEKGFYFTTQFWHGLIVYSFDRKNNKSVSRDEIERVLPQEIRALAKWNFQKLTPPHPRQTYRRY